MINIKKLLNVPSPCEIPTTKACQLSRAATNKSANHSKKYKELKSGRLHQIVNSWAKSLGDARSSANRHLIRENLPFNLVVVE